MNDISIFKRVSLFLRNNIYYLIGIILLVLLIFSLLEYYKYYKDNKIKKISLDYYQAVEEIYSNELNSEKIFKEISITNSSFALLSSLKLAEFKINNNKHKEAYKIYKDLIENSELEQLYHDFIIIHALYNLIDHISNKETEDLLSKIDIKNSNFKSHFYEIQYINLLNRNNRDEIKKLYNFIQSNIEIINPVKERIKKINDYLQHK